MGDPKTEIPTTQSPPRTQQRKRRGEVIIFENWCKGCGLCIHLCPTGVLGEDHEGHPVVLHPEKCTACQICELHCPDFAIAVHKTEEHS